MGEINKPENISFFTCFLLIFSRKSALNLSCLKSYINCFNEPPNDWFGFTKSKNVKSLVKKDEKLTKIEFFKMFRISIRICFWGGAKKFSLRPKYENLSTNIIPVHNMLSIKICGFDSKILWFFNYLFLSWCYWIQILFFVALSLKSFFGRLSFLLFTFSTGAGKISRLANFSKFKGD